MLRLQRASRNTAGEATSEACRTEANTGRSEVEDRDYESEEAQTADPEGSG